MENKCIKCGNENISLEYIPNYSFDKLGNKVEKLKNICKTCGYIWYTPTLDSKKEGL